MKRRGFTPTEIICFSFNLQITPILNAFPWFTVNYLPVLSVTFVPVFWLINRSLEKWTKQRRLPKPHIYWGRSMSLNDMGWLLIVYKILV